MQSENIHIDEFFRKKEEEWTPGNERQNAHWNQMQSMLIHPGTVTPGKRVKVRTSRRISRFLGGFAVITIITIITYTAAKTKKAVNTKSATAKTAVQKSAIATVKNNQKHDAPAVVAKSLLPAASKKESPKPVQHINHSVIAVDGSTPPPDAATLLNAFYKSFEKAGQEFFIQTARDTVLTASEGTRLSIPARAFANQSGKVKTGIVKIVLTEYYKYDDIAAAKLSTTSNGEQLVTGGMLNIKAEADGEELMLAPKKNIELAMPTNNYDKRMQLFTGNPTNVKTSMLRTNQWGGDSLAYETSGPVDGSRDINWVLSSEQSGIFAKGKSKKDFIEVLDLSVDPHRVKYGKRTTAVFLVSRDLDMTDEQVKEELKKRHGSYFDKIKIRRVRSSINSLFIDSASIDFGAAMRLKLVTKADSIRRRAEFDVKNRIVSAKNDQGISNKDDLSYYRFTSPSLGWINCDRFSNNENRVAFTLNLGEGYDAGKFMSQIIFTRYRSIMNGFWAGSKIQFQNIPENEPVQLISVGVKDGKVVSCIQSLTVTKKEVTNLTFEETTPEQFRKKLESLKFIQ